METRLFLVEKLIRDLIIVISEYFDYLDGAESVAYLTRSELRPGHMSNNFYINQRPIWILMFCE